MSEKIRWQNFKPIYNQKKKQARIVLAYEQPEQLTTDSGIVGINSSAPKNHFRVLAISDGCKLPVKVNDLVFCIAKNPKRMYDAMLNKAEQVYVYDEGDVVLKYDAKLGPIPFGEYALIKRRNRSELRLNSKIVIPEGIYSKDQTLDAEVVRVGESPLWRKSPINEGDLVSMIKWDQSMIEIRMPNGEYMLIVHRKFLSHVEENNESIIEP